MRSNRIWIAAGVAHFALAAGCAGPVSHMPEASTDSWRESRERAARFDVERRDRQIGFSPTSQMAAVDRVLPHVHEAARRVCLRHEGLSRECGERMRTIKVKVIPDSPIVNASADLKGTVRLHGGLVRASGNDDELAAVIAHEYAHVLYDHVKATQENAAKGGLVGLLVGGLAVAAAGGGYSQETMDAVEDIGKLGGEIGALTYSKEMELEADQFAVYTLAEAGMDPLRGGDIFVRMEKTRDGDRRAGRKTFVKYFDTHPTDDKRRAQWYETVRAVRRGQDAPKTPEEVAQEAQAWRWAAFQGAECAKAHARYDRCPAFAGGWKSAVGKVWTKGGRCPPPAVVERCSCPKSKGMLGGRVAVKDCRAPRSLRTARRG